MVHGEGKRIGLEQRLFPKTKKCGEPPLFFFKEKKRADPGTIGPMEPPGTRWGIHNPRVSFVYKRNHSHCDSHVCLVSDAGVCALCVACVVYAGSAWHVWCGQVYQGATVALHRTIGVRSVCFGIVLWFLALSGGFRQNAGPAQTGGGGLPRTTLNSFSTPVTL